MPDKLSIFVHRASECLTDYESHGDGLICFSLLNGLAERGHQIFAYTNAAPIRRCSPNLHIKTERHRVPANSLAPWEHSWRAERWMKQINAKHPVDLVWRMHPYGYACPTSPQTLGKPLVVGPLFYRWPENPDHRPASGKPRFGVSLQGLVKPFALLGWDQTLEDASLILCATEQHVIAVQEKYPKSQVRKLPVIVDPPIASSGIRHTDKRTVNLLFVAHLSPNKNAMVFCESIKRLRKSGIQAHGMLLGDGVERPRLEQFCAINNLGKVIRFRGKVPNDEVHALMQDADFLLSTSFGEPYGRGIAEAMSVGTPCVCHRSGGPADFISDGVNGLLVDELTGDAYASAIQHVFTATEDWNILSQNAQHTAAEWRSEVVLTELEKQLYQTVSQKDS